MSIELARCLPIKMNLGQLRSENYRVYMNQDACNLTIDRLMSSRLIETFVRLIVSSLGRERACTHLMPRMLQTFQTEDSINTLEAQVMTLR